MTSNQRKLPSVNSLLEHPEIQNILATKSRTVVTNIIRETLSEFRTGEITDPSSIDNIVSITSKRLSSLLRLHPQTVVNASGVILHTNLGRAPLSKETIKAVSLKSGGYNSLEMDLSTGKRGSRQNHIADLLKQLTGAEDALVVNNNAAALYLCLSALVHKKNVIVSRGEAVEIGGNFRIPEIASSGLTSLKEVGTTNRTYINDYAEAADLNTGAFLKVHTSNFKVLGFTHGASITELVELSKRRNIPLIFDIGSGSLLKTELFGLSHEPMPQEAVKAGVDITLFSGDKLLGGPQAGIIIGKKHLIDILKQHPLSRILRIDKLNLVALIRTLIHYLDDDALTEIPIWRMISRNSSSIYRQATHWSKTIGKGSRVIIGQSTVGGGSLPGETLPTWLVAIDGYRIEGGSQKLSEIFRNNIPPIIGRLEHNQLLLDVRTVYHKDTASVLQAISNIVQSLTKR